MVEVKKIAALGEVLIRDGLITQDILHNALAEQRSCGCRLGRILIGKGYLNNLKLYRALAKHYDLPFADLMKNPVDSTLLKPEDREVYLRLGIVPWRRDGNTVTYAATEISPTIHDWIIRQGGEEYDIAITSPVDIAYTVQQNFFGHDDRDAREILWRSIPDSSAKTLLVSIRSKVIAVVLSFALLVLFLMQDTALHLFVIMSILYAITLLFKSGLFVAGVCGKKSEVIDVMPDAKALPVYTILVPLYREADVLPQLIQAIRNFDYPKSKLDVKLIVEEGDTQTIDAIKALRCESYFEIIPVPYSLPQTKPKACNYALKYAKGEYLTIYDAEDVPDPMQLRQVVSLFINNPDISCVQAKLNYYNREENILSRMFSLEYGIWFNLLLQGLERLDMPIPLGGTSNHIKLGVLKHLFAWDPYNVTEDADLGVRLAANGYKTAMVDSLTQEESPLSVSAWLGQRSRWIKGYMQTYLVYMRSPYKLWKMLGTRGFLGFQLFIGAPCLIFLVNPIMWGGWLYITLYGWKVLYSISPAITALFGFNLVVGLGLQLSLASAVVIKHKWWSMLPFVLYFPCYWVLHSLASVKALWQLVTKPHWWEKTNHGLSGYIKIPSEN